MPADDRWADADARALLARVVELEARVADLEALEAGRTRAVGVGEDGEDEVVEAEAVEDVRPAFRVATPLEVQLEVRSAAAAAASGEVVPYEAAVEPSRDDGGFERAIGLRLAGWAGAGIVVFGLVLGAKYAYDAGLVGLIPAGVRLALLFAAGAAFVAAGEAVYRRVGVVPAAGLFAAGIATLFVASFSGHAALGVYGETAALVLMGLTAVAGAAVAVRGKLVSVALLSLAGGHLAPLVLGGGTGGAVVLLAYVLALQVATLAAAWRGRGPRWWAARWAALAADAGWVAWLLAGEASAGTVVTFAGVYATAFVGEVIASTRGRARSAAAAAASSDDETDAAGATFVVAVAAGLVVATLVGLDHVAGVGRAGLLVAYTAAFFAAGFAVPTGVLRSTFHAIAAAIVAVAVPVALTGASVVIAWGGMAAAFGVVGGRTGDRVARAASVVAWVAGVAYLVFATANDVIPAGVLAEPTTFGLAIPAAVAAAWGMTIIGLIVARLLAATAEDEGVKAGRLLAAIAGLVWAVASVAGLPPAGATVALLAYAWLVVAATPALRPLWPTGHALAALLLATAKWAVVDLLAERVDGGWSAQRLAYLPAFNPITLLGSLLLGSILAVAWLRRRVLLAAATARGDWPIYAGVALLLTIAAGGLCLEIDRIIESTAAWPLSFSRGRTRQLSFTMILAAATAGYAGFVLWRDREPGDRRRRLEPPSYVALAVAVKFVLIDLGLMRGSGGGDGVVLANLETLAAAAVVGVLAMHLRFVLAGRAEGERWPEPAAVLGLAGLIVALLVGVAEVWRGLGQIGVTPLVRQAAVSAYLAAFAVAAVVAGFRFKLAGLRYFGLALLAVAAIKAFAVDLRTLSRGWRTLSFVLLGLFLLGTSVLYGTHGRRNDDRP